MHTSCVTLQQIYSNLTDVPFNHCVYASIFTISFKNKVKGKVTSALKCPVNKYSHAEFQFIWQNAAEIAVSGFLQIFFLQIAVVGARLSMYNFPLLAETSKCQNSRSNLNNIYMF